nr:MAG TPA: hypothetical protein [Caudoviricetes sp.]
MTSVFKVERTSGNEVGRVVLIVTVQYHFINIDSSDIWLLEFFSSILTHQNSIMSSFLI